MAVLMLIGRILFSIIFIRSGIKHFTNIDTMAKMTESNGLPAPKFMVGLTGLMILLGGISILLGVYVKIGSILLLIFLIAAAFTIHNFWTIDDPMRKAGQQAQFYKNLALAGASLLLFAHGAGSLSL